jgi:hypothetical protein
MASSAHKSRHHYARSGEDQLRQIWPQLSSERYTNPGFQRAKVSSIWLLSFLFDRMLLDQAQHLVEAQSGLAELGHS